MAAQHPNMRPHLTSGNEFRRFGKRGAEETGRMGGTSLGGKGGGKLPDMLLSFRKGLRWNPFYQLSWPEAMNLGFHHKQIEYFLFAV